MRVAIGRLFHPVLVLLSAAMAFVAAPEALAQSAPLRWDGQFELVSGIYRQYDPVTPGNGPSQVAQQAMSADGRWVVYRTDATNLGFQGSAVYRLDRRTGEAYAITGGVPGLGMSADGHHIVWDNCWGGIPGANCAIFAIDTRTWNYTWLSAGLDGTVSPGDSQGAVLSSNGRYAVFASDVQPLTGDPMWGRHIVWRDRDPDGNGVYDEPGSVLIETISTGPGGFGDAESATPQVSDDGRYVAFRSLASNLVPGDFNGTWDVFLRDRLTGETRRLSSRPGNDPSPFPIDEAHLSMSADGRYVAFASADPMLVVLPYGDVNDARDVYVYDRDANALSRVEAGRQGSVVVAGDGATSWPTLSADGRYVALQSTATNVPGAPPPAGSTQVYVADRETGTLTRVSVMPDGTSPDASSTHPTISADGSVVLFESAASNYLDPAVSGPEQIYAAAHLAVDPMEVRVPGSGGLATFTVTAHPHTRWWPSWDYDVQWLAPQGGSLGPGDGSFTFQVYEPNPTGEERSVDVRVGARTMTVIQEPGLALTSVSPAQGPASGGTVVTLHGSGFEAGTSVWFNGEPVAVQSVTPTAITVVTPFWSSADRSASVMVQTLDGRWAMLDDAFTFVGDVTPPLLYGTPTGTPGLNGWFVSNVGITWTMSDPDSAITSTSCSNNSTYTLDTAGQTISCFATSGGGTTWASVTFKKDATPPVVTVTAPQAGRLYDLGAVVNSAFTCTDARSGVAACGVAAPAGAPIDTATPGLKTFSTTATDAAGNLTTVNVAYGVGAGVCSAPPSGLKSWMRFENALVDTATSANTLTALNVPVTYVAGEVGQAFNFAPRTTGGLSLSHNGRLAFSNRMSVAAWVKRGAIVTTGTLVQHPSQFKLEISTQGGLTWTLNTPPQPPGGWTTISGSAYGRVPQNAWTHVAMTFDAGALRLYIDGRLDSWWQLSVTSLMQTSPAMPIDIGVTPLYQTFTGALDELQFYDRALDATEVTGLYLAGTSGVCPPVATTLEAPPVTTTYGAGSYESTAILRDAGGIPVPGKTIALRDAYTGRTANLTTDATGTVRWTVPFTLPGGTYPTAIQATFAGDVAHVASSATGSVTVQKATPVITWPAPAPITYGTALSATQLNATVNVAGTKTYTPAAGAVPGAGLQTLHVSFVPTSQQNYANASSTVTLEVRKALPTVTVTGGTFLYDGQPHLASATVTGVGGANLGAATFTYNGSTEAPVAAGVYTVVATFAGDANHESRSATGTLTIDPYTPVVAVTGGTFTYDAQPHAASATVTGVGTEVPPGTVTITYNGSTATPVDAGTYAVTASVPAAGNYRAASASGTLTILKATATLSLQAHTVTYDGQPHPAIATATGANGASLSPVTITYDGGSTVPRDGGAYAVEAAFAGDANHLPASATATLLITKAVPVLGWNAPAPITYGTPLSAVQLNATSSAAGTFVYEPAAGSVLAAAPAHPLTATFTPAEPRNYEGGTVATTIAVQPAPASVTVTGGAFTYDGQPHAANASAAGVGGAALSPVTVTYNGAPAAPVDAGSYEVVATFAGDANHAAASATTTITIGKADVAMSWSAPAAIGYGTPLSAAQLNATAGVAGTFAYSPAAGTVLGAGASHPLTATFTPADPANYIGGTIATAIAVAPAPLTVRTNDAAKIYGAPLPGFTASFTGLVNGDTPATIGGALVFATGATSASAVGAYAVTPGGLSSPNYAIAFAAGTLTIVKAPVTVTLIAAPTPSGLDMPITFTATVAAAQAAPAAPAGTVRFFDGATLLGSATLSNGTLTLLTGGLTAGSHSIEARYDGDLSFDLGTTTAAHVVNTAAATPAITITSSRQPASTSQSVTFTATITVATSGTIGFYDGNTLLGSGSIAAGRATLTVSGLAAGSHAITARFQGNASAPPVISPVFVQSITSSGWKDRSSTSSLTSSANPSALGATVTFTATVSGSSGTPAGRILFMIDGLIVGDPAGVPVTTVSSGTSRAAVSVPGLTGGRHKVTATYLGSSNYRGSNGALTQAVN